MTITKQTALNEILVRLNNDGSVGGAHVVEIEHLTDTSTGEILSSRLLQPRGVTVAEVGAVLGAANAGLLEQIDQLTADLAAANTAKTDATTAKTAAEQARDAAVSEKAALQEQLAALNAQLHPVDSQNFPVLSAVQVRLALLGAGITFDVVDGVIEAMPAGVERDTARTYWEYATQFHRSHPFIAVFTSALGMTSEQVDAMWMAAGNIA
jgi:hypothetical protein